MKFFKNSAGPLAVAFLGIQIIAHGSQLSSGAIVLFNFNHLMLFKQIAINYR